MDQEIMLTQIHQTLQRGKPEDSPAYTLILGAGASFGVVPTAKQVLGIAEKSNEADKSRDSDEVRDKYSIPLWLRSQKSNAGTDPLAKSNEEALRDFWREFLDLNADLKSSAGDGGERPAIKLENRLP